jgi:hypothetical protein
VPSHEMIGALTDVDDMTLSIDHDIAIVPVFDL